MCQSKAHDARTRVQRLRQERSIWGLLWLLMQDILKDQWSPALTIKTALISLQALLCTPQPDDPQDAEVASMYMNNHETFVNTAKFWTETYARPDASHDEVRSYRKLLPLRASRLSPDGANVL